MEKIILIIAISLSIFFRVWQIARIPAGLAMDEAAFGYNAWSVSLNGRDEYGKFLPYAFRSFADFKLPSYGYLTALVVKFFGPGVWQTRAVSVTAGLFSCLVLFYLVHEVTKNKRLAVISALIMLWSPWGIIFSRGAFEGNLGLFFFIVAGYGLAKAMKDGRYLFLAAVGFSLANYSYLTYKFVGPAVFVAWLVAYRKIHKFSRMVIGAIFVFLCLSAPAYLMFFNVSGGNRIGNLLKLDPVETGYPVVAQLTANYLTYFSPRNLFFRPDPVRQRHFVDLSTFYPWMVVPWGVGAYLCFMEKKKMIAKWVGVTLAIAPIPAAITQDPFATLRALPMFPAYAVLIALGIMWILDKVSGSGLKLILVSLVLASSSVSLYSALMVMKRGQIAEWNGGIERLAIGLSHYQEQTIFIDIPNDVYPNLALALRFPPEQMQAERAFDPSIYYSDPVFPKIISFGRYRVGEIDRSVAQVTPKAILVTTMEKLFANEPQTKGWREIFSVNDDLGRPLYLGFSLN